MSQPPAYAAARPSRLPWADWRRLPWRQGRYCALDLETTGLDLRRDHIISVGAVHVDGGRVIGDSSRYWLVAAPRGSSPAAVSVHGLRPADLADAPPWPLVADEVLGALAGRILVAHAAWVERAFLRRALAGSGVREPRVVIDTAALARAAGRAPASRHEPSLEWLAADLGLPPHEPHHALGDALTTAEAFLALAARMEAPTSETGPPLTTGALVSVSARFSRPARLTRGPAIFRKIKGSRR